VATYESWCVPGESWTEFLVAVARLCCLRNRFSPSSCLRPPRREVLCLAGDRAHPRVVEVRNSDDLAEAVQPGIVDWFTAPAAVAAGQKGYHPSPVMRLQRRLGGWPSQLRTRSTAPRSTRDLRSSSERVAVLAGGWRYGFAVVTHRYLPDPYHAAAQRDGATRPQSVPNRPA
jgi:hypothetical protein